MNYTVEIDNKLSGVWEDTARLFSDYTIYQTLAYQQIRAAGENQQLCRILIRDSGNNPILLCIIRIKRIPVLGLRIGYIQWGPLSSRRCGERSVCAEVWRVLRNACVPQLTDVLRIVPNIVADKRGKAIADCICEGGFERISALPPYHTIYVSVSEGEKAIRNNLHRSWRRILKKAEQVDLEIEEGSDVRLFHVLETIYNEAKRRKGFRGLDPAIFMQTQERLKDGEKMHVVVAQYNGVPVCAHASSFLGRMGEGILAASTEDGLNLNASYLVWWRTLVAAWRAGMDVYNLGGIDPVGNPTVYQFKTRLGGQEVHHIGTFEAVSSPLRRQLWRCVEKGYRFIRP